VEAPIGGVAELSLGCLFRFQVHQFYTNGKLDTNTCTEAELKFVKKTAGRQRQLVQRTDGLSGIRNSRVSEGLTPLSFKIGRLTPHVWQTSATDFTIWSTISIWRWRVWFSVCVNNACRY